MTIDHGKGREARPVQVRTQVRGYSYTYLASFGVLLSTVPATRNMVPPHHLCPGGKTALRIRPAAVCLVYGKLPQVGTQIPGYFCTKYGCTVGPHSSVSQ